MASPGKLSMETILTFDNRDTQSQWSMVWSTTHLAEMDHASARTARRRRRGRRRLRIGSLALSSLMVMHCRLPAAALTGELFFFMVYLVTAVVVLANPVRHFEVYLGQWSISGPGRAFRMIPMFEGIGIAMGINAVVRAITCCTVASVAASYVYHSVSDVALPHTYCRNFDSETYSPLKDDINSLQIRFGHAKIKNVIENDDKIVGLDMKHKLWWKNDSFPRQSLAPVEFPSKVKVCKEMYAGTYPPMYDTPAYNYFYVQLVQYRDTEKLFGNINIPLGATIIVAWLILWIFMVKEKILYSRLIYNNIEPWFVLAPWIWSIVLLTQCASNLKLSQILDRLFKISNRKTSAALADACEIAVYIHSVGVGTELIHGKALHNYASGHIDPLIGDENIWHSGILLMLTMVHTCGATMCALIDNKHFNPNQHQNQNMHESALWILPMYSNCTSMGNYSHFVTTLIFGGLVFAYMAVAFVNLKTALHTIFEYRVKLVYWDQYVVACLILFCMAFSMLYATTGGVALLESVDAIMSGCSLMFVAFLEVVCLIYVYRGHDFMSDMDVATEENACSTRIGVQWHIFPVLALVALGMRISALRTAEMPSKYMILGTLPIALVVLSLALRAVKNACAFKRHPQTSRPPPT